MIVVTNYLDKGPKTASLEPLLTSSHTDGKRMHRIELLNTFLNFLTPHELGEKAGVWGYIMS